MADTDSAAEFLQDLIATNPNLVYLEDEFPEVKVVVSADYQVATNNAKVAVVAGGNEETDPLRNNSLTAAVYGDSFQPPSPSSILSAIRGVTNQQGQGCLLLVKEGELRNYKRAAKLAKEEYFKVDILSARKLMPHTIAAAGASAAEGNSLVMVKEDAQLVMVKEDAQRARLITKARARDGWDGGKKCAYCGELSKEYFRFQEYAKHLTTHKGL